MLTNTDVQELTWWFAEPAPVYAAGRLGAQTYDPRGSGTYDPTTDTRLESMLSAAMHASKSDWSRIKRVIDELAPLHREVLRRAFGPLSLHAIPTEQFRYPDVAAITRPALERAAEVARHNEHTRQLEVAQLDAVRDGCSPMAIAIRVLEADRRARVVVTEGMVHTAAYRVLASTKESELVVAVKLEMQRLVDEAGDAYRAVRAAVGGTKRQAKAEQRRQSADLLDQQLGRKRRKSRERFVADPKRAELLQTVAEAFGLEDAS